MQTKDTLIDNLPPWVVTELTHYPEALRFVDIVYRSVEVWDDIIDRDNRVTPEDVHAAFTALLLELPFNRFFEQHKAALVPAISMVIVAWHASNAMPKDGAVGAHAFTLRKEFINLILLVVTVCRGLQRSREIAAAVWIESTTDDKLEDFQKGK